MKNRLLTVLLSAILIIGSFPTAFSSENADIKTKEMDFLENVGGFSNVKISPKSLVTRGEFASILANICKINSFQSQNSDWNSEIFGADNNDTLIIEENSGLKFEDVDTTYPYHNEILAVTTRGYMNGVAEKLFAPEFGITLLNASKVMLDVSGYEPYAKLYGGYPAGYQALAIEMGLANGISKDFNDKINQQELAKLIYNTLDVSMLKLTAIEGEGASFGTKDGETFMTEVLKLEKYSGVVTDNGITSFYSQSKLGENEIKIEDTVFDIAESAEYVRDFIGRHINAYVSNEDDEMEIIYATLSGKDEIFEFSIDDMEEYTDGSITYYDGRKNITKKLSDDACLILNGVAVKSFNEETFSFDSGKVTLISQEGSSIDLIVIDKYEYMYVKKVDINGEFIYGSYVDSNNAGDMIDLSEKSGYENITIKDAKGNSIKSTDIFPGHVLKISENSFVIELEIIDKKIEGFELNSIYYEDDDTLIKGDEGEFKVSKEYLSSTYKVTLKTGENYNLYLGEDNLVVWIEEASDEFNAGFLVKAYPDENDENTINLKLYGFDGKMQTIMTANKIKILAPDGKNYSLQGESAYNLYLNGKNSLIRYNLNSEGKITYIEFPTEEKNKDGQLFKLLETDESTSGNYGWVGEGTIGSTFHYDSQTKFMKIPANLSEDSKYSIPNATSYWRQDGTRELIAYASKPNTAVADYVIFKTQKNEVSVVGDKREFIVVESITEELVDDEIVMKVTGMKVGEDGTARLEIYSKKGDNGDGFTWFENIPDTFRSKTDAKQNLYDVSKGDIIRAIYDEYNMVSAADIVYRPTAKNPNAPESKSGFLLGSTGIAGQSNGNPYRLGTSGGLAASSTHYRGAFGWVIRTEGTNILQVTTQDLSVGKVDVDNIDPKFKFETFKMNNQTLLVEYSNGKVSVREGKISDIKTYEEAGNECSRVFYHMYWGTRISTIIINGTM